MVDKARTRWNVEQFTLVALGIAVFILGATVNRDRSNLAVTLVGLGVLLIVLAALLPRLKSISAKLPGIGEISADLLPPAPSVSDRALVPSSSAGGDLRGASPYTSNAPDFEKVVTGGPATYVTITLENGKAWLSSRLYVFVSALAEARGIGAVVFTSRSDGIDTFAGVCPVGVVLTRLAWAFPWLPNALAEAWSDLRTSDANRPPRRRLASHDAARLFADYVHRLQITGNRPVQTAPATAATPATAVPPPAASTGPPPLQRLEEWQDLGSGVWEHANWLDEATITELMGDGITKDFVAGSSAAAEALQAALSKASGQYIAVLNDRNEVRSVIDRLQLFPALLMAQGIEPQPR